MRAGSLSSRNRFCEVMTVAKRFGEFGKTPDRENTGSNPEQSNIFMH